MNTGLLRPAVATVLTVYGIETSYIILAYRKLNHPLQQCLPLPVLKHPREIGVRIGNISWLQQCLPFTVLKRKILTIAIVVILVATVLTVYGIETMFKVVLLHSSPPFSCNSAYRLRY